ncbi:hypothetical protein EYF80_047414 [Liparis tanakae]|uniref:Uncharacterized protein n=1 Tax=Liparis tanakae TaxID=230148 RepID=A0A4Z2FMZ6_9TELE|nr:hypothetical protein EYF80_047414 [Liparis tanakae]
MEKWCAGRDLIEPPGTLIVWELFRNGWEPRGVELKKWAEGRGADTVLQPDLYSGQDVYYIKTGTGLCKSTCPTFLTQLPEAFQYKRASDKTVGKASGHLLKRLVCWRLLAGRPGPGRARLLLTSSQTPSNSTQEKRLVIRGASPPGPPACRLPLRADRPSSGGQRRAKVAPLRERAAFNRETMTEETSVFYLVKVKQRGQGRSAGLTQINSCVEESPTAALCRAGRTGRAHQHTAY